MLYYIAGYVASKEKRGIQYLVDECKDSEFTLEVSRGKLSHPPKELFDLSLYYYTFFKGRTQKCCNKVFLEASTLIYESSSYEFDTIYPINRRFTNCFFKAFVVTETDKLVKEKDQKNLKKRKLDE